MKWSSLSIIWILSHICPFRFRIFSRIRFDLFSTNFYFLIELFQCGISLITCVSIAIGGNESFYSLDRPVVLPRFNSLIGIRYELGFVLIGRARLRRDIVVRVPCLTSSPPEYPCGFRVIVERYDY